MPDDRLAGELAAIREREQAATPGPWWSDQDDLMYRLHGVHQVIPAQFFQEGLVAIPEQVMNKQIAKAPKSGTPYAEYWPDAADDTFITSARTDVPRLLAAVEAALAAHAPRPGVKPRVCGSCVDRADGQRMAAWPCPTYAAISAALLGEDGSDDPVA